MIADGSTSSRGMEKGWMQQSQNGWVERWIYFFLLVVIISTVAGTVHFSDGGVGHMTVGLRTQNFQFRQTRIGGYGFRNNGSGFLVGNRISTRTHTRANPTRVPGGYVIPVVKH